MFWSCCKAAKQQQQKKKQETKKELCISMFHLTVNWNSSAYRNLNDDLFL